MHRPQGNGQVVTMMRTTSAHNHKSSSLPAASRCAAAPTARGATTPCMVLTAKRPRIPPSSGTSTRFATAVITTTVRRVFTTSRAGTTTLPAAGSSTPTGYLQMNKVSISTCLHRRLHTKLYYELVNIVIVGAYNSAGGDREQQIENVTSALKAIRSFIFVLDRTTPKF